MTQDKAMMKIIRQYLKESKKIRFEGNGYSSQWHKEAAERGLKSITSAPEAFKEFVSEKTLDMFEQANVLTHREAEARYEVLNEIYIKKLQIEARVLGDLTINHVIPTAFSFQKTLISNVIGIKELFPNEYEQIAESQIRLIKKISGYTNSLHQLVHNMVEARKVANLIEDYPSKAESYHQNVLPYLEQIRKIADKLEMVIDDELWPLPKYREMLFFR